MKIPKIQDIKILNEHLMLVEFSDGSKKRYDISPLLKKDMFAPLRNFAFFKNCHIEPGGYAVVWNADIDISEYEIWRNGETVIQ